MLKCWSKKSENRPTFEDLVEKLLDFKWMVRGFYDFEELDDDFELPYAWEVHEKKIDKLFETNKSA